MAAAVTAAAAAAVAKLFSDLGRGSPCGGDMVGEFELMKLILLADERLRPICCSTDSSELPALGPPMADCTVRALTIALTVLQSLCKSSRFETIVGFLPILFNLWNQRT